MHLILEAVLTIAISTSNGKISSGTNCGLPVDENMLQSMHRLVAIDEGNIDYRESDLTSALAAGWTIWIAQHLWTAKSSDHL